jgi:hypothetical protein
LRTQLTGVALDRQTDLAKLRAAFVFFIRVVGAALTFGSQVFLARWISSS